MACVSIIGLFELRTHAVVNGSWYPALKRRLDSAFKFGLARKSVVGLHQTVCMSDTTSLDEKASTVMSLPKRTSQLAVLAVALKEEPRKHSPRTTCDRHVGRRRLSGDTRPVPVLFGYDIIIFPRQRQGRGCGRDCRLDDKTHPIFENGLSILSAQQWRARIFVNHFHLLSWFPVWFQLIDEYSTYRSRRHTYT